MKPKVRSGLLPVILALLLFFAFPMNAWAADVKISEMTAADSANGADLVPIVQSGANKKATVTQILDAGASRFLQILNNLDDLDSASEARTNLGLGSSATQTYTEYPEDDLGTLTWTGSEAPASLTAAKYRAVRIGGQVTLYWRIEYATAGTGITKLEFDWPAGLPTCASPTGQSANELAWPGTGNLSTSMTGTSSTRVNAYRDSGDTKWVVTSEAASGNYKGGTGAVSCTTF
jgi:hypothetical protein